ncbi:helix-turn-helix domain-containing protein [Streptomyces sp. GMY02]|uniref:helix-turn-helix domain-containing protein n=1 Tax=Streptomyces sp. GMY02 TaxID=1333528 RepID=UPI001C2C9826|nr:helix-turn-helix domain-containing protein [Streptomyces sp. GMY02]QXE36944.1 helix-turn-helix domain-containing protein [Streptomyces sp. GMY02]
MPDQETPDLLTTSEVAAYLRKPVATVRGWRYRKVGPIGFRLGRDVVYRRTAVDAWLAERERASV